MRRLSICLYPCHVRPTEEVRVSSPRLLQMETQPPGPRASEHAPRPSTFGASADEESAVLTALVTGICETNTVAARRRYLFDNVDVPAVINFMAVFHITQQGDGVHANVVPYRDSNGNGEWRLLPWDMNIAFGQIYGGDHIVAADDNDIAHPLYGSFDYRTAAASWSYNRMQDAIIRTPETREMYLRRLRSLMEELLQSPGTPLSELKLEKRINQLRASMKPEADLDRKKWG